MKCFVGWRKWSIKKVAKYQVILYKCKIAFEYTLTDIKCGIRRILNNMQLSKSTYYDWLKAGKSVRRYFGYDLYEKIKFSYINSGKTYGYRRIAKDLNLKVHPKILRYTKEFNYRPNNYKKPKQKICKTEIVGKYERIIKPRVNFSQFFNVFSVDIIEKVINGVRCYTCGFYDIKNKKIYGLTTLKTKGSSLIRESFLKMIDEKGVIIPGTIIHSDNGSEFKALEYKLMLMNWDIIPSMSRVAMSTDNGWIEGFWSTMKRETLLEGGKYYTFDDYDFNLKMYAKFYNNKRISL